MFTTNSDSMTIVNHSPILNLYGTEDFKKGLIYNFYSKLTANWTKLSLHLNLGPPQVTQPFGSAADINPSTQRTGYTLSICIHHFDHYIEEEKNIALLDLLYCKNSRKFHQSNIFN